MDENNGKNTTAQVETMPVPQVVQPKTTAQPEATVEQPSNVERVLEQMSSQQKIDNDFTRMLMEDEKKQRAEEEKRNRRKALALGMGELGHVIVDAIKAGGGVAVDPRDLYARYNELDTQRQNIIKNYQARMDLLQNKIKGNQDKLNALAFNIAKDEDARIHSDRIRKETQAWSAAEAEKQRQHALRLSYIHSSSGGARNDRNDGVFTINFGNPVGKVTLKKDEAPQAYGSIFNYMVQNKIIPAGLLVDITGQPIQFDQKDIQNYVNRFLGDVLQNEQHRDAIYKIITQQEFPQPLPIQGTKKAVAQGNVANKYLYPLPQHITTQAPQFPIQPTTIQAPQSTTQQGDIMDEL